MGRVEEDGSLEVKPTARVLLGDSAVTRWFDARYPEPTPAQSAAWPGLSAGANTLIVSPTGTGKTLAAFLSVLHALAGSTTPEGATPGIRCLYVSPLRALGYDLEKNLRAPLREIYPGEDPKRAPIRVGLRNGDTPLAEREGQFRSPPEILLTTPESLCLLLSQPKWLSRLATVRWVIVDEIHALAENKRGTQLALALERLEVLRPAGAPLQRIGLSATVHPLSEVASFLVGAGRPCALVEAASPKQIQLSVYSPLQREPYPPAGFSGVRLVRELAKLIRAHRTTLVFTNTRSGAESATYWLKEQLPELAVECHHASLDREARLEVEDRLKRGELRAVVCSTSLELGLDIGCIDLVVMLATPKGVSKALQRAGRAGHGPHQISRGLLMATNVGDLVECCATAVLARRGQLDALRIPTAPLDVLAQHLVGLGCTGEQGNDATFAQVRCAWPYRDLPRADFDAVLDFLAGGGRSLRQQYTELFGKVVVGDGVFETRAGATRRDFLQNVGTIPDDGAIQVIQHRTQLGSVEEGFLRSLRLGDVFTLGGRPVRLVRVGLMECWVERADGAVPTVPRWGANKFPLANRVAREIRAFRGEVRGRLEAGESAAVVQAWIARRLDCGANNAAVIYRVHAAQHGVSEIPTGDFLLVEELRETAVDPLDPPPLRSRGRERAEPIDASPQLAMAAITVPSKVAAAAPRRSVRGPRAPVAAPTRHYFFHSLIGRAANDALSRVVGLRLSRGRGGNAVATTDDYGFVLTVADDQSLTAADLPGLLSPEGFGADLAESLGKSDLLKYHFRSAAQTGLMVYRNHFSEQKTVRKLQWSTEVIFNVLVQHEPDHVLLREARRDAEHSFLDAGRALAYLEDLATRQRPIRLRTVPQVPPLSFGMYATRIKEALLVEDPRETLERLYHHWWAQLEAEPQSNLGPPPGPP